MTPCLPGLNGSNTGPDIPAAGQPGMRSGPDALMGGGDDTGRAPSARTSVELRPALEHRGRIVLIDVAGVELVGLPGGRPVGAACQARPVRGLKRGGAEG